MELEGVVGREAVGWYSVGLGPALTRLASRGRAAVSLGKYHSPLVRSNEMESTSGTPLGTPRLGRQRPSV